ncbi:MAG: collagen-like protein [Flavobacteriaceae bacterium]|nr:collagen-like protein [Flavobacteriaceae bacterium]
MKKLLLFLAISSTFLFSSCEGEDGQDGINILGQVYEVTTDLNYDSPNNLWRNIVTIPNDIVVYESDVVLVYLLEDVSQNGHDLWSPLPQNFFLSNGDIIQYVYNHTFFDVEILIDGNFDLISLGNQFTDDQTFRIAIVPAEYATANLSMEELLQNLEINNAQIETISN